MKQDALPKNFFKNNPLNEYSSATMADFSAFVLSDDRISNQTADILSSNMDSEQYEKVLQDRALIVALDSGAAVERYMRSNHHPGSDAFFYKKAMDFIEDAAPLILKRYKTTTQDRFIELAFQILAQANPCYTEQLLSQYEEIRNPYAQAMVCLLLGEHWMTETVPFLVAEHKRFKTQYPDEDFDQCPLLALHIIFDVH